MNYDNAATELADLRKQFQAIQNHKNRLVSELSSEQMLWRPDPKNWSIAHCLEHLNIVNKVYLRNMEPAISQARTNGLVGDAPGRYGLLSRWFINSLEPPPKRRFRAPKMAIPAPVSDLGEVLEHFDQVQERLLLQLEASLGLDLNRIRVVSPLARILRFPLGAVFAILTAHERRHLWQGEQVRGAAAFPKA